MHRIVGVMSLCCRAWSRAPQLVLDPALDYQMCISMSNSFTFEKRRDIVHGTHQYSTAPFSYLPVIMLYKISVHAASSMQ